MRRDLMDILVCPVTKSALTLEVTSEENGDVIEGTLRCEEGHVYPINDGIPNLLPPDLREAIDGPDAAAGEATSEAVEDAG
jgi:uncharacterized protein YbaR (Trm112 family)